MASESKDGGAAAASAPQFITLVSSDKHRFIVDRRAAMVSGLVRTMLSQGALTPARAGPACLIGTFLLDLQACGRATAASSLFSHRCPSSRAVADAFRESGGTMELPEIPAHVLERVVAYMHYKLQYNNSRVPIPEFPLPPEVALEVLVASNYLDL